MDEQPQKKRMGRPPGRNYRHAKNIQLSDADNKLLKKLASTWGCSEAAAIRMMIRASAKRERLADDNH